MGKIIHEIREDGYIEIHDWDEDESVFLSDSDFLGVLSSWLASKQHPCKCNKHARLRVSWYIMCDNCCQMTGDFISPEKAVEMWRYNNG